MKNYSRQREEIIRIVELLNKHLTAEEIYFEVKKVDTSISRSTVYRNLIELVKNEIFIKIPTGCGNDKYESIINKKNHGHIICTECGEITEFWNYENLIQNIVRETNFSKIVKPSIVINGKCNSCIEI